MGQSLFTAYAYAFNASLLLIANKLFKPRASEGVVKDFTPTTLATQGAFIPLLIGRRRIGCVVGWAGDRRADPVTQSVRTKGSKKKTKNTGQVAYSEGAWHLLCVGPARRLYRIYEDGNVIWEGPIDSSTTPSGSTLETHDGTGDTFQIWWGEEAQPVNSFLAAGHRLGISSRWPFHASIVWVRKTLGAAPRWRLMEYDLRAGIPGVAPTLYWPLNGDLLESIDGRHLVDDSTAPTFGPNPTFGFVSGRPFGTGQSASFNSGFSGGNHQNVWRGAAVVDAELAPGTDDFAWSVFFRRGAANPGFATNATSMVTGGNNSAMHVVVTESIDQVSILGVNFDLSEFFPINEWVHLAVRRVSGVLTIWRNGAVEHTATVGTSFAMDVPLRLGGNSSSGLSGNMADFAWWRRALDDGEIAALAGGASPLGLGGSGEENTGFAGSVGHLLLQEAPQGLGLPADRFDLASLAAVSAELADEGIADFHLYARDGEEAIAVLAGAMADAGVLLYRNPDTGLLTFGLQRQGSALAVPADMLSQRVPEVSVALRRPATRLVFDFPDAARAFRDSAIKIDDDGEGDRNRHHRPRKIPITTQIEIEAANVVAQRRSQEELAGAAAVKAVLNRGARRLHPGSLISLPGVDEVLRVLEVRPVANSGDVEVAAVPDYYGSEPSTYEAPGNGGAGSFAGKPVAADPQATFVEVPAALLAPGEPATIVVPRVRAHDQITRANVYLSGDGTTYQLADVEFDRQTGGELLDPLPADAPWEIDEGPTVELQGPPDDDVIEDLTGDDLNWARGRQVALIGEEIFFVRKLTALGGTTYRLDGLLRARYDTDREAHAIGAPVFVFRFDGLNSYSDPLIYPGADLRAKAQPVARTALGLDAVTPIAKTIYGKGVRPPRVTGLSVQAPMLGVAAYETGDDVRLVWASRLAPAGTGAGEQGAGTVVAVGVLGLTTAFEIRVYDDSDDLVRTEWRSLAEWTYSNADLQDDLGGETDFRVEVREFRNGHFSAPVSLTVEAL